MRPIKEIENKIEEIQKERKTLPSHSMFGTPNWQIMDTEIRILEDVINNKRSKIFIKEKLDFLCDKYGGNFPKDDTTDKAKMDTYDWLLEQRDEL